MQHSMRAEDLTLQHSRLLECFQILKQLLFVLGGQLGAVGVASVAVSFFSRIEKKIRLR